MEVTNAQIVVNTIPYTIDRAFIHISGALGYLESIRGYAAHTERCRYHLESALYQLQHPTNEIPQTKTDATSV